jgi:hypothetical protein
MSSLSSQKTLPRPPGATTPTFVPKFENHEWVSRRSTEPTQSAFVCEAGKSHAGKLSLPAAMTMAEPLP